MNLLRSKILNLLNLLESLIKTDVRYLVKGSFWLSMGTITTSLSGLILTLFLANFLPKETLGSYKYILSFIGILSIPTLMGMGTALTKSVSQGYEGSINNITKIKIIWGLGGLLMGLMISAYYFIQNNNTLSIAFFLVAIFIPIFNTFGIYTNFLQGKKEFGLMSLFDIYIQIISTLILVSTLFLTKNILILILVYLLSWTLLRFIFFRITIKKFPPNKNIDKETISYGKHLSLLKIFEVVSGNLDKILLWHFLGPIQVAVYFMALSIPTHLNNFLRIINRLAFPKLAQRNIKELKKTLIPKIIKMYIPVLVIFFMYILFSPIIYKIFFPQYTEAIIYSQIFSLILLTQPLSLINTTLTAHSKIKSVYLTSSTPPIIQSILIIILIPLYGIHGAIISNILSKIFYSGLLIYLFKKEN